MTLSEQALAGWQCLVAFMKALDLLHREMHVVSYHRFVMTIETAIKVGTYNILFVLFAVALMAAGAIWSE